MLAALQGEVKRVKFLLGRGAKGESATEVGDRPDFGSGPRHAEVVKALLAHGAKVDFKSYRDMTPLMAASKAGSIDVVRLLIAGGAQVNAKDRGQIQP